MQRRLDVAVATIDGTEAHPSQQTGQRVQIANLISTASGYRASYETEEHHAERVRRELRNARV